MADPARLEHAAGYSSSNLRKHLSSNPLQRYLLDRFHATAAELLAACTPTPQRVLDAGCGEGFAIRELAPALPRHTELVGLDGAVGALHLAAQLNPLPHFIAGDLLRLPFDDRQFDLVLCMEVLEHLTAPEQGLAEICRAASRWLLVSVPNEPLFRGANFLRGKHLRAWGNDPGHLNHWSAGGFARFLRTRCTIVTLRTSFPWTLALCRVR